MKDVITTKIYLRIYNWLNSTQLLSQVENPAWRFFYVSMLASHISSFISPAILTPYDIAKTKTMCEIASSKKAMYNGSFFSAIGANLRAQGYKSIFQGTSYAQLNAIISSALVVSGTHAISVNSDNTLIPFIVLNALVSLIVYPIDTIT